MRNAFNGGFLFALLLLLSACAACNAPSTAMQTPSPASSPSSEAKTPTSLAAKDESKDLSHLSVWVGKYPFGSGQKKRPPRSSFLELPEIHSSLEKLLGASRLARLQQGYYLTLPIELVEENLVLDFPPNLHLNTEDDRIVIVINLGTGAMHAAIVKDAQATWKHTQDTQISTAVLRNLNLQGAGNMNDETTDKEGDTIAPEIEITTPQDNATLNAPTLTVNGTVSDPNANASGVSDVRVNGRNATRNVMQGTWTIDLELKSGRNEIIVQATDHAGNTATKTIYVTRR